MYGEIRQRLREVSVERDISIVCARERGSRMLGVEHDDSDWDVLFLFSQSPEKYAQLSGRIDTIHEPDDPIDLHGWNVDKFGELLSDSNPNAIEFCRTGATEYFEPLADFGPVEREARDNFNHMALYHHYISMARSNYEKYVASGKKCTKGRQFYVARAIACAQYIRKVGELPPMDAFELSRQDELDVSLSSALLSLSIGKREGRGTNNYRDIVGGLYERESNRPMNPTDERTNSPDPTVIDEFIGEVVG